MFKPICLLLVNVFWTMVSESGWSIIFLEPAPRHQEWQQQAMACFKGYSWADHLLGLFFLKGKSSITGPLWGKLGNSNKPKAHTDRTLRVEQIPSLCIHLDAVCSKPPLIPSRDGGSQQCRGLQENLFLVRILYPALWGTELLRCPNVDVNLSIAGVSTWEWVKAKITCIQMCLRLTLNCALQKVFVYFFSDCFHKHFLVDYQSLFFPSF